MISKSLLAPKKKFFWEKLEASWMLLFDPDLNLLLFKIIKPKCNDQHYKHTHMNLSSQMDYTVHPSKLPKI